MVTPSSVTKLTGCAGKSCTSTSARRPMAAHLMLGFRPVDSDGPEEIDLEERELCGDDTCIGVIGPDGRCKECGRTREQAAAGVSVEVQAAATDEPASNPLDEDRELCGDDTCIGIIAPDGHCKECC